MPAGRKLEHHWRGAKAERATPPNSTVLSEGHEVYSGLYVRLETHSPSSLGLDFEHTAIAPSSSLSALSLPLPVDNPPP